MYIPAAYVMLHSVSCTFLEHMSCCTKCHIHFISCHVALCLLHISCHIAHCLLHSHVILHYLCSLQIMSWHCVSIAQIKLHFLGLLHMSCHVAHSCHVSTYQIAVYDLYTSGSYHAIHYCRHLHQIEQSGDKIFQWQQKFNKLELHLLTPKLKVLWKTSNQGSPTLP